MKRALRIATVLGAASIAACFTKPGAPHATGDGGVTDSDARGDGPGTNPLMDAGSDANAPPACIEDDFNNMSLVACNPWGNTSGTASYNRIGMVLAVNFAGSNESGTCTTNAPMDITHGTSIKIAQMPPAGPVELKLVTAGKTTVLSVQRPAGQYSVHLSCDGTDLGTSGMSGSPPGWLQLRIVNATSTSFSVLSETSSDGLSWSPGSSCGYATPPSSIGTVSFTGSSGSGAGSALFDNFNTQNCP